MREFIMEKNRKEEQPSNNEKPDVAMANFRKILKEKQELNARRKKKAVSYGTKVAIALVLFVGAVTLKNQTDKISVMEQQIIGQTIETEVAQASGEAVLVEELPGNVEELPKEEYEEPLTIEPSEQIPVTEEQIEQSTEQPPAEDAVQKVQEYEEYIVQSGDTLAKISRDFYGSDEKISEICSLNGITNGDYIQAGEIILLP